MKYLYYSLYLFYVKIIQLHKLYPPIINITAVMSFLITILCFSVVNASEYDLGDKYPRYTIFIPFVGFLILYKLLYDYYKPREAKLLKEMDSKPLWQKIVIISLSFLFIILVVKLWMFDGMNDVYQFIKKIIQ